MDFNMLFVDHRDVVFGEQEWQDSIAITSKFIAYSGEELKQDSLLVYYSIDGGEYMAAHMTPTGNPDEYVGYIKGYQGNSEIDYYVFGADNSGRRYSQPVFAELDPHHFTMEEHTQTTLTISVNDITFDEASSTTFTITNNTANEVTINSISEVETSYLTISTPQNMPVTLAIGESLDVNVDVNVVTKSFAETTILVSSTTGEQSISVSISGDWLDIEENVVSSY